MKITKLGHCCMLIEQNGVRILTDPGNYSTAQDSVTGIDFVVITHEHTDHLHIESVKAIIKNNREVKIITNSAVSKILAKENISSIVVEHNQAVDLKGISIKGWGSQHAPIYKTVENVENTGYIIADRLLYPGDAFTLLDRSIDILALPIAGPWMKISEAMDYVLAIKPKKCFPVHDGNLRKYGVSHRLPKDELSKIGIEFIALEEGQSADF
jgi:L-ascorbate metabolism protein UlaG (beta-lactamase superfamily)